MPTRREALSRAVQAAAATTILSRWSRGGEPPSRVTVNDRHSRLNATTVREIVRPRTADELAAAVGRAVRQELPIAVSGGRHAMGGQQFATDALLLDLREMNRVLNFDRQRGLIEVEAGIQWPALIDHLLAAQQGESRPWAIHQKQTGADQLTLGGALAANIHGRGLRAKPFIADVECFELLDADGNIRRCSRGENRELFSLAAGGYGLFGIVTRLTLRLVPRQQLERLVQVIDVDDLPAALDRRLSEGCLYGDFQYAIDPQSEDFLRKGVFSCYRPVESQMPIPDKQRTLSAADWHKLLHLAHTDKSRAFDVYAGHYLSTHGQRYWSDTQQLSLYLDDYHRELDRQLGAAHAGSEMITEIYVPRDTLPDFLAAVRADFRRHAADLIYGTVRWIEQDDESFLAWARRPWACIIFNLHVDHTPAGIGKAAADFRRLIDRGLDFGGSYYLTYHRWAAREQLEAAHPRFGEFLRQKRRYDPNDLFQSDWYRHHRAMFGSTLGERGASAP